MSRFVPVLVALAAAVTVSCGRKGDPLPPINRSPVAPDGFVAERRGDSRVNLTFVVPATNSDGTRPANIERIDVYALTGPATLADNELIARGTRIASLPVKSPRNPDDVVDAGDDEEVELVGTGLDHGATASVHEDLAGLLAGPGADAETSRRQYIAVGISTRGRRGLISKRAAVSLLPAPSAPATPGATYDEKQVTLTWVPVQVPSIAYHVYGVSSGPDSKEVRLTPKPVTEPSFVDALPKEWNVERCYAVSSVEDRDGTLTESSLSSSGCVTLVDKFAPGPPAGFTAVAADGAVSLTWDANAEPDIAGYIVLRGTSAAAMAPLATDPIPATTFRDTVPSGVGYVYAVLAVDRAGNRSAASIRVEATAR